MPRTAIPIISCTNDAGVVATTAAVDVANGHSITGVGDKDADKLCLIVANTAGASKNVTVRKAAGDPFKQFAEKGDLVVAVAAGTTRLICLGDGARYRQTDGALYVDYEAATTGTIIPALLP